VDNVAGGFCGEGGAGHIVANASGNVVAEIRFQRRPQPAVLGLKRQNMTYGGVKSGIASRRVVALFNHLVV
jgi:hypothetical protein